MIAKIKMAHRCKPLRWELRRAAEGSPMQSTVNVVNSFHRGDRQCSVVGDTEVGFSCSKYCYMVFGKWLGGEGRVIGKSMVPIIVFSIQRIIGNIPIPASANR